MAIASPAGRSAGAFRDAQLHSRKVRLLRMAAPLCAVAAVVAVAASAILQPLTGEIHVDTTGIAPGGASVAMDAPRMRGFNSQDRAYEVAARTARQTLSDPNRIDLDELSARIELADKGWAALSSPSGVYDADAQVLTLARDVRLVSDKGDDARLASARAEMSSGRIVSDRPVAISLGGSRLTADRMEVLNGGDRVLFEGRVRMTLRRAAPASATAQAQPPLAAPLRR